MDLNDALGQFDKIEANLHRLNKVWEEMVSLIYTEGRIFGVQDERRYETLRRALHPLLGAYRSSVKAGMTVIP